MQRSFNVQDRERDSSKPSSSLTSPAEDKERVPLASSEGWEKTKMKGRRSATIKAETHVVSVANGSTDGEREHKGNAQHQRPNVESRSRPSEGHGYRYLDLAYSCFSLHLFQHLYQEEVGSFRYMHIEMKNVYKLIWFLCNVQVRTCQWCHINPQSRFLLSGKWVYWTGE